MKKLNDFILVTLLNSMLVLGGCSLVETVLRTDIEVSYFTGIIILALSSMVYRRSY